MNFKIFLFFLLFFIDSTAYAECNAKKLIQAGKKMPSLLKKCPHFSTFWWNNGATSLHLAAFENDVQTAQKLLNTGANVNARNNDGETPIFYAVQFRYIEMIKLLIKYNASLLVRDNEGATPLNRLIQISQKSRTNDTFIIQLFLTALRFHDSNTCKNSNYILMAADNSIQIFQKKNGTIATYTPLLYGTDGFGNSRIQTLIEDNTYPNTIRVVLDLNWNHEREHIRGHLTFNDFLLLDGFLTETRIEIKNLVCPWKKWKNFIATVGTFP